MTSFSRFIAIGFDVIKANPSIVIPLLLIYFFNHYSGALFAEFNSLTEVFLSDGPTAALRAAVQMIDIKVITLYLVATFVAAVLSVLAVTNTFLAFRGTPKLVAATVREFSLRTTVYFFLTHILITALFACTAIVSALLLFSISVYYPMVGLVVILVALAFVFIVYYAVLSFAIVAICSGDSFNSRIKRFRWILNRTAITALLGYYLVRIGLEIAIFAAATTLLVYFSAPAGSVALLAAVLLCVPLVWFRTTGFALKLWFLKDDPWFSSYFAKYYETHS